MTRFRLGCLAAIAIAAAVPAGAHSVVWTWDVGVSATTVLTAVAPLNGGGR